jgi:hypothetical protein
MDAVVCRNLISWLISMLVFDIVKISAGYIQICSTCIATTCPPLAGPGDMVIGNALLSQYLRDCYIRFMGVTDVGDLENGDPSTHMYPVCLYALRYVPWRT